MPARTAQPRQIVFDENGALSGPGGYTPEPRQWTYFYRNHIVPRMFKPANGGWASLQSQGAPFDMSSGVTMGELAHLPIILTHPDRRSGLTVAGDGVRGGASMQRIPPVLVRTSRR